MTRSNIKSSLIGFSYSHFNWIGKAILKVFKNLPSSLDSANIRIYPEAYASFIGFSFILSFIICSSLTFFSYIYFNLGFFSYFFFIPPIIILILLLTYPNLASVSRASNLEAEVPFVAAYITVMATGRVSPYRSMERLKNIKLLPNLSEEARRIDMDVKATGIDPVSALEKSAKIIPSKEYKSLILGYVSTLRGGGDIVHFLQRTTEKIFEARSEKAKAIGERIGMLMEGYAATGTMLALGLYVIFIVSQILPAGTAAFSSASFILFAYIFLPALSFIFLYLTDIFQPRFPVSDWRPYKVFALTLPITFFLLICLITPFYFPPLKDIFKPIMNTVFFIRDAMGLGMGQKPPAVSGFEIPLGLCITIMVSVAPAMVAYHKYATETSGIDTGITRFLRDLVELRKTGMSPEKCIENLSKNDYGAFSKYLIKIAEQIKWGFPLSKIYSTFAQEVYSWLARINMFLIVDAIDVGGGTPETLETLATFSEEIELIEKQKRMMLKPLLLIPYISAIILVVSTVVLIGFMRSILSIAHIYLPFSNFVQLFVPPLILNSAISGFVAGKVSEEKVSAGFKHAFILTLVSLIALAITPYVGAGIQLYTPGG
jgi:flagellar protein FlaJ